MSVHGARLGHTVAKCPAHAVLASLQLAASPFKDVIKQCAGHHKRCQAIVCTVGGHAIRECTRAHLHFS